MASMPPRPQAPSSRPERVSSFAPRGPSAPPRAADPDGARMASELERHRNRAGELEDELRTAQARITELEDGLRRSSVREHEVQRLERELEDVKSRLASGKAMGN